MATKTSVKTQESKAAAEKASRAKPASYPALSLALCLKKAQSILGSGDDAERFMPPEELAELAGYKGYERNSAPKGFIAALSHFGLLEKDPRTRHLRFSGALRELDWADEEGKAIVVAAALRAPAIHQAIAKACAASMPPAREKLVERLKRLGLSERPAKILAANMGDDFALAQSLGVELSSLASAGIKRQIRLESGLKVTLSFSKEPTAGELGELAKEIARG